MAKFLVPHPPASPEEKRRAVAAWRELAAVERRRIELGLCHGDTKAAEHNAALYDRTADEIERELSCGDCRIIAEPRG